MALWDYFNGEYKNDVKLTFVDMHCNINSYLI